MRHPLRLRRPGRRGRRLQPEGRSGRRRQAPEGRGRGGRARRQGHGGDPPRLPGRRPAPVLPRDRAEHPALRRAGAAAAQHGHHQPARGPGGGAGRDLDRAEGEAGPARQDRRQAREGQVRGGEADRARLRGPGDQSGPDPDPRGGRGRGGSIGAGGPDYRGERRRRSRRLPQAPRQPVRRRARGAPGCAGRPSGGGGHPGRRDLAGRALAQEGERPPPHRSDRPSGGGER